MKGQVYKTDRKQSNYVEYNFKQKFWPYTSTIADQKSQLSPRSYPFTHDLTNATNQVRKRSHDATSA